MSRLMVNMQASLANPNVALEAAKRGDLKSIPAGATARIDTRALGDLARSGLSAVCVTVGHVAGPGDPVAKTHLELQDWAAFLAAHSEDVQLLASASDLTAARSHGRPGVILGFQNTDMLAGDLSSISGYAQLGVRVMQLTYNGANAVGHGCLSADDVGLSSFGREALRVMSECGVLVDLSHAGAITLRSALEVSAKPLAISHSACRSLVDNPRNVWDEDLRRLADRGGVVGIYAMPFLRAGGQPDAEDWLRHIEHALNVAGTDHVGIGTDGTITPVDDLATYLHYLNEAIEQRRAAGIAAPGEEPGVALFLPDLTGPSQFERLAERLRQRGHAAATVDKVLGGNWARLLGEVWPS